MLIHLIHRGSRQFIRLDEVFYDDTFALDDSTVYRVVPPRERACELRGMIGFYEES